MKNVIVTGGAGFLGSHVTELLLRTGRNVIVIDDFSNGKAIHLDKCKDHSCLKIVKADIAKYRDIEEFFSNVDAVVHLAVLDLRLSIKDPLRVNTAIVDGTLNCLELARKNKIMLFLNCSSSEVYGTAHYVPMDENHPLNPETPYAAAKVAQDMYVRSYGSTFQLPWLTVRPFNMYGPHSHWQGARGELIPKMIVRAMNKQPLVVFGDGRQTRDFIFVKDAAQGIVTLLDRADIRETSVNLCSGKETQIGEIAKQICNYFNLAPSQYIENYPPRPGDVMRHLGSNDKAKLLFDFEARNDLNTGLPETIEWFKSLPYSPEELLTTEVLRNWE
jgi:UDP-glucose 4-epimerase